MLATLNHMYVHWVKYLEKDCLKNLLIIYQEYDYQFSQKWI